MKPCVYLDFPRPMPPKPSRCDRLHDSVQTILNATHNALKEKRKGFQYHVEAL